MINLFEVKRNENYLSIIILVIRLSVAVLMIIHGLSKLNMLLKGGDIQFPDPLGVGKTASLTLAVFAEIICSFLLFIGLATRLGLATLPLIITMLVAVFVIHGADPIDVKEMAILYLLFYLLLLVTGGGKFSVDYLISKKSRF